MRKKTLLEQLQGGWSKVILPDKNHLSTWNVNLLVGLVVLGGMIGTLICSSIFRVEIAAAAGLDEIPQTRGNYGYPPTPKPTTTPTPISPQPTADPDLPSEVRIEGVNGHRQSLPLSCEARSAVDWAAFFGKEIDEIVFFDGLPIHENPEMGFVGDVNGSWGQIPPKPYGVHAKPVAQRLREFGLNAKALKGMSWEELQSELADNQPVILWVVGHIARGTPVPYTDSNGQETTVAKFEHTVIAIGFTENKITVVDGANVYSRHKGEFLKSWGVLENQAVIWID